MAKRITGSTPKLDGYRMPAEFEPQAGVWMLWPERNDNWRDGAKPAQKAFLDVATAILQFEPVTACVSPAQYQNARERLPRAVRVVEMASNDAWIRDCGPTFLVNDNGGVRAVDWTFNAWGGLVDGLYFPWDLDDQVAQKVCEIERVDSYRTEGFVLEGGSIHVDGEGTVLTTEMCLLSEGRNPDMDRGAIERMLCDYLGCEKVLWLRDGIDPEETNGHIDDVACFIRPGEVACIWTDDPQNPFYQPARDAYDMLSQATDAKGRKLKVHKLCLTQQPCLLQGAATIDAVEGTIPREDGEVAIASYMNFLIVNGGVILPQYGDANDALAVQQVQAMFPERRVVGVQTREVAFGGGNIHCITPVSYTHLTLPECTAMSQGYIGYHLQQGMRRTLRASGMPWQVATVVTQVVVDPDDPAFDEPTKPIGAFYDEAAAQQMMRDDPSLRMREDSGRGWRRVVASPKPVDIAERRSILNLLDSEYIVIACGGGGVPVVRDSHGDYYGVDAVIDKDFASACLAEAVGADYLFILTAVDHVCLNFGTPEQRELDELHVDEAETYLRAGQFGAGSRQPKVAGAVQFVRSGWRRRAVIASLEQAPAAMRGESGTRIVP